MRSALLLVLSLVLYGHTVHAQCETERFKEKIFNDIVKFSNVQYGANTNNLGAVQNLYMDISMPPLSSDTLAERPVILFMHGGAFVAGDKTGGTMRMMCDEFSRRGYVAVAVQYRLEQTDIEYGLPILAFANKVNWYRAILRSAHDIKGAVRYLKYTVAEAGNPYGIDTNNFTLYGSSAGAIGVLHTMYLDEADELSGSWQHAVNTLGGIEGNTSEYPQYGSTNTVKNLIVDSGALAEVDWIGDNKQADVLALHHNADPSVPYNHGCFYVAACHLEKFYGAQHYVPALERIGARVVKHIVQGVAHPVDDLMPEFALEKAVAFLYDSQCKYYNPDTTVPTGIIRRNVSEIKLYPNPNSGTFTVSVKDLKTDHFLQIHSVSGQVIYREKLQRPVQEITLNAPNGVYFLTLSDVSGVQQVSKLLISK